MIFGFKIFGKHDIDFDDVMESIESCIGDKIILEFNTIIYEALNSIAHKFIKENKKLFSLYQDDFTIYCNYMDSHIFFENEEVQSKFEDYF